MRVANEKFQKTVGALREEIESLRLSVTVSSEQTEGVLGKVRDASAAKFELERLYSEHSVIKAKQLNSDLARRQVHSLQVRMDAVFGSSSLWSTEAGHFAREVSIVSVVSFGLRAYLIVKDKCNELRRLSAIAVEERKNDEGGGAGGGGERNENDHQVNPEVSATQHFLLKILVTILKGIRFSWIAAIRTLKKSAQSNKDETEAIEIRDLFERISSPFSNDAESSTLSLARQVNSANFSRNALEHCLVEMEARGLTYREERLRCDDKGSTFLSENFVNASFCLQSIQLLATEIPKFSFIESNGVACEICKSIYLDCSRVDLGQLVNDDASVHSLMDNFVILNSICNGIVDNACVSSILQTTLSILQKLLQQQQLSNQHCQAVETAGIAGSSILDDDLVWSMMLLNKSELFSMDWLQRVAALKKTHLEQERRSVLSLQLDEKIRVIQTQLELRDEEARVALLRCDELEGLLARRGISRDEKAILEEKALLAEIKTLAEALEITERRSQGAELELKQLKTKQSKQAKNGVFFESSSTSNSSPGFSNSISLLYWRQLALTRITKGLNQLCSVNGPDSVGGTNNERGDNRDRDHIGNRRKRVAQMRVFSL